MMIGNSVKSDVISALEAGFWGVFVPHERFWAMEHAAAPHQHPRFFEMETTKHVPALLQTIDR